MSFIRYKQRGQKWYAYEVTNTWDKELKKYRQTSCYLGISSKKGGEVRRPQAPKQEEPEKGILDFGDGFAIAKSAENMGICHIIADCFQNPDSIMALICYQLSSGSAMYNCNNWIEGNIASKLFPKANLSSQGISNIINNLGKESIQRRFFKQYINTFFRDKHGILIDSSALPSAINSSLNGWGHTSSGIEQKVGCLLLVDKVSKFPIFFRAIPGEIPDVSTLKNTLDEIRSLGLNTEQAIFDAGYFSESNIQFLCEQRVNFLSRMPKSRAVFHQLVGDAKGIESSLNAVQYGKRVVFIEAKEIELYGHKMFAYVILDPEKKAKDTKLMFLDSFANPNESVDLDTKMRTCGIFVLISSSRVENSEILPSYYSRQAIEQVFGFAKTNSILPLRVHSDQSINGYLLLFFLSLVVFIQMRQKLIEHNITLEQALMVLRNVKAKVFDERVVPQELTKKAKDIFRALGVTVPTLTGI